MTDDEFIRIGNLYKDSIFRLSFTYLKNFADCDDVVQNTLLKLYTCRRSFESDEHIKNWLFRVAVNECRKIHRYQSRSSVSENIAEISAEFPDDEHRELFEAVNALEAKYRTVIYLYYYEGFRTDEIAVLLRRSSSTVRTQLQRAREQLKRKLSCEIPE